MNQGGWTPQGWISPKAHLFGVSTITMITLRKTQKLNISVKRAECGETRPGWPDRPDFLGFTPRESGPGLEVGEVRRYNKKNLIREGYNLIVQHENIDFGDYLHEWDLSDEQLLDFSDIKRCPKCGSSLECDDGVIHCSKCDWVLD